MIYQLKNLLKKSFPFLVTLFLLGMDFPFWNPVGILAIIPVFYYSFIKPVPYFPAFSLIVCMAIDFKSNLVLYWTIFYCAMYAFAGLQNYFDFKQQSKDGLFVFMVFFSICNLILLFYNFNFTNLFEYTWLVLWTSVFYVIVTDLHKRITNDR